MTRHFSDICFHPSQVCCRRRAALRQDLRSWRAQRPLHLRVRGGVRHRDRHLVRVGPDAEQALSFGSVHPEREDLCVRRIRWKLVSQVGRVFRPRCKHVSSKLGWPFKIQICWPTKCRKKCTATSAGGGATTGNNDFLS
jgi:hypothetical protein